MKTKELTEKILNRVVYYLQGALEIQEDLLFDHLNIIKLTNKIKEECI